MKALFGGIISALLLVPVPVFAAQSQDSVTINATVLGQPPADPPIIDSPLPGSTLQEKKVDVKGTCVTSLVVKVFRNGIFAGSTLCQPDGTFSLQIDLVDNTNDLVARQYDLLSQPSPPSETVQVFYSALPPAFAPDETSQTASFQLIIDYDYNFQGVFIHEPFNLPIHFTGGSAPYAVSVDWGDGETNVFSRKDASQFFGEHAYAKAGPHMVKIRVSDSDSQEASLQFVLIVNGGSVAALPIHNDKGVADNQTVWEAVLYSSLTAGAVSFTAGFLVATFWDSMLIRIKGGSKT
jgi:hypothetical protein